MPLESQLKKTIFAHLKKLAKEDPRLVYRKRHGSVMGVTGDPDVYGLYCGTHFELELKLPGNNPTEIQAFRLEEWGRAGAVTGVIRSIEELDRLMAMLRDK